MDGHLTEKLEGKIGAVPCHEDLCWPLAHVSTAAKRTSKVIEASSALGEQSAGDRLGMSRYLDLWLQTASHPIAALCAHP